MHGNFASLHTEKIFPIITGLFITRLPRLREGITRIIKISDLLKSLLLFLKNPHSTEAVTALKQTLKSR